jgi:predicted deacylase
MMRFISALLACVVLLSPGAMAQGTEKITISGVEVEWNGYTVIEPESNVDISTAKLSDFTAAPFSPQYPVTVDTYLLEEGKLTETTVFHVHSDKPGPSVYIVAGVHGDERAAWYAGILLRTATISSGDLYILAPANANGARRISRYVTGRQDVNRSFPGDKTGNEAEQLAHAIFNDIDRVNPDLVFDLHEALIYAPDSRDFLGSTYIFTILDGIEDLFFDLLFATQDGTVCHNEFGYNGPGPAGSINAEVSNRLGIPAITVETFRGFPMDRRVSDQLDSVRFALEYLGMR